MPSRSTNGASTASGLNVSNLTDKWYLKRGINRNIFFSGPERSIKLRVAYTF
jgi:hypothetical protein